MKRSLFMSLFLCPPVLSCFENIHDQAGSALPPATITHDKYFASSAMKYLSTLLMLVCLACTDTTEMPVDEPNTPGFQWLTAISGPGDEVTRGVTGDDQGNVYIAGSFTSSINIGSSTYRTKGMNDIFLAKLSAGGHAEWSRTFGSAGSDLAFDVDGDASGNHYVTGMFTQSMQLPGGVIVSSEAEGDVFTAKISPSGVCEWVKIGHGPGTEYGNEANLTSDGHVLIIGPTDRGITFEDIQLTNTDDQDVFVTKYTTAGNLRWAKLLAGAGRVSGRGISSDRSGNSLIAGSFSGTLSFGNQNLIVNNSSSDVFIAKLDNSGTTIWARSFGDTGDDYARGIDADADGNIYVSGVFSGTVRFDTITLTSLSGSKDIFLLKLSPQGAVVWAQSVGGPGEEEGCELEVNDSGDIFMSGSFAASMQMGSATLAAAGQRDVFICRVSTTGKVQWARAAGGTQDDVNYAITLLRRNEEVVTVGTFSGVFFQAGRSIGSAGRFDSYVSKVK
ncbi:MAG: hypothetical protein ACK475_00625 [Bacteroidota bacterium]|jgi:hypothetical protein